MAARAQFEQIRRGLPAGMSAEIPGMPPQAGAQPQGQPEQGGNNGLYL